MKYLLLFFFAFCIQPLTGFAQSLNSPASLSNPLASEKNQYTTENKEIGLNHLITDSLTNTELLNCSNVTIENPAIVEINFYSLTFIRKNSPGDSDIISMSYYNDELPVELIQKIVLEGVDQILIENVTGTNGSENFSLGHRWFYLKRSF